MFRCIICGFDTYLDDAVVPSGAGRCICLQCFQREVGSARKLSRQLRQDLTEVLALAS